MPGIFFPQRTIAPVVVRVLAVVLAKFDQPPVIGEIIAGIILGPSILGSIPGFTETLFPKASLSFLSVVANLGLIFFMFFLGLEVLCNSETPPCAPLDLTYV
jgi:Kef-type K+ transport system membrane component KefB